MVSLMLVGADNGIVVAKTLTNSPPEKCRQRTTGAVGGNCTALICNGADFGCDGCPADITERKTMQALQEFF